MISKPEFYELVANAYQSLYDFVRLRNHPLTQLLLCDDTIHHKEKGWQTHHALLEAVEELYPGSSAPPFSREWRRHRLMVLRYVEAMDPQAVADQLAISRRQYYREHAAAIEAVADILWERCNPSATDEQSLVNHQTEAMQQEVARLSQSDAYADLGEVIEGVLAVLERVFQENDISITVSLPAEPLIISIGHNLLRQTLLGVIGVIATGPTTIRLSTRLENSIVHLLITPHPPTFLDINDLKTRLATFQDMLRLGHARISLIYNQDYQPEGFDLELLLEDVRTVLVVDDNEDTLAFYKRCLTPNRYRVITTSNAHAVLKLACEAQPDIIILDLMMPEQDGWDLLQLLSNRPDTAHIPIMICTVLKQKQLALSLGASAFLEKPFTEQTLLAVLEELRTG